MVHELDWVCTHCNRTNGVELITMKCGDNPHDIPTSVPFLLCHKHQEMLRTGQFMASIDQHGKIQLITVKEYSVRK